MKTVSPLLASLAACALALGGCAATAPGTQNTSGSPARNDLPPVREGTLARLAVDGPNAYLNGRQVAHGSYVSDGDTVSTGPGTSAMLILNQGGYIQLDENTDPLFKEGLCLLMKMLHGQVLFSNVKCQEVQTVNMAAVAHSVVNIQSVEQETRMTVIDGQVEVRSPSAATVGRYGEYFVARDGTVTTQQLTAEQAASRMMWSQRYFRVPAAQAPDGVSAGGAAAVGAIIGGIMGIIRSDKSTQPPAPASESPAPPSRPPEPAPPPAPPPPMPGNTDSDSGSTDSDYLR